MTEQKASWHSVDETNDTLSCQASVPFYVDGLRYHSLWQYYMASMALFFKQYANFKLILSHEDNPSTYNNYVATLSDYDAWANVQDRVMLRGLEAKFQQNPQAAKILKETKGTNIFAYLGPDLYWGAGIPFQEASLANDHERVMFPGLNRLGELIVHVRDNLP